MARPPILGGQTLPVFYGFYIISLSFLYTFLLKLMKNHGNIMNVEGITQKIEQAWVNSPKAVISIDGKINETVINTVIKNFSDLGCKVDYRGGRNGRNGRLIVELPQNHPTTKALFQNATNNNNNNNNNIAIHNNSRPPLNILYFNNNNNNNNIAIPNNSRPPLNVFNYFQSLCIVFGRNIPTNIMRIVRYYLPKGKIFIAGGFENNRITNSTLVLDLEKNRMQNGPPLPLPRRFHAQIRLSDGKVMLIGGDKRPEYYSSTLFFNPQSLVDPQVKPYENGPDLPAPRAGTIVCPWGDDEFLIAGGANGVSQLNTTVLFYYRIYIIFRIFDRIRNELNEKYNNNFSYAELIKKVESDDNEFAAGPVNNVLKGLSDRTFDDLKEIVNRLQSWAAELNHHPNTPEQQIPVAPPNFFIKGPDLLMARSVCAAGAIEDSDGQQLVIAGGYNGTVLDSYEIFNRRADTHYMDKDLHKMPGVRCGSATTPLSDGRLFVSGGYDGANAIDSTLILDPKNSEKPENDLRRKVFKFTPGPVMSCRRDQHSSTLLPDNRVMIIGGHNLNSTELYDPVNNSIEAGPPLPTTLCDHSSIFI